MTEYWKSTEKKYCDICKCWITGSTMSIQVHENGVRHKMNAQEKLREIQKKAKSNDKEQKNLAKSMRRIEEAASAAAALDKEANPDMSLKIQSYMEYLKEKEVEIGGGPKEEEPKLEAPKVKILHRDEKDVNDSLELPTPRPYMNRFGGWTSIDSKGPKPDLELPSSSYSVTAGKSKKKKSSTASSSATVASAPVNYTAKLKEKPKHIFAEKTVPIFPSSSSDSGRFKTEPGGEVSEVAFKKRKLSRPNARQPLD